MDWDAYNVLTDQWLSTTLLPEASDGTSPPIADSTSQAKVDTRWTMEGAEDDDEGNGGLLPVPPPRLLLPTRTSAVAVAAAASGASTASGSGDSNGGSSNSGSSSGSGGRGKNCFSGMISNSPQRQGLIGAVAVAN